MWRDFELICLLRSEEGGVGVEGPSALKKSNNPTQERWGNNNFMFGSGFRLFGVVLGVFGVV